VYTLGASKALK